MRSPNPSTLPKFSQIYIERDATDYPVTTDVIKQFPKSELIIINKYQEFFNRPRQPWRAQKESTKLILALKREGLIYQGSNAAPNFGYHNFFYNTPILNCLYDCNYCYLQGMLPSANIVIFVNQNDFFNAVDQKLQQLHPLYLCISYDTDLLALEQIVPLCRSWIEFAATRPNLTVEIRTKSTNFKAVADLQPATNVILAWTLSPPLVIKKYESGTPSLKGRLTAAKQALDCGWNVRICFDPILNIPNHQEEYRQLIRYCHSTLNLESVHDISLGVFRINSEYLNRLRTNAAPSPILHDLFVESQAVKTYPETARSQLLEPILEELKQVTPNNKVYVI